MTSEIFFSKTNLSVNCYTPWIVGDHMIVNGENGLRIRSQPGNLEEQEVTVHITGIQKPGGKKREREEKCTRKVEERALNEKERKRVE